MSTSQKKRHGSEHPSQLRPFFIEPLCLCGFYPGALVPALILKKCLLGQLWILKINR